MREAWTHVKKLIGRISFLRSMRVYFFGLMLLMGVFGTFTMRIGILKNYEQLAVNVRISDTQTQFKIIANHLLANNYLLDTSNEAINAELEQMSNLYDGRVLIINNNFKIVKDTYGISEGKYMIAEEVIRCFNGTPAANYDSQNGYIEMTIPILPAATVNGNGTKEAESDIKGVMLASVSTASIQATMTQLERTASLISMLAVLVALAASMALSFLLTRPFTRMAQAINEVKDGFTDEPIGVRSYSEMDGMLEAFNQLLKRMRIIDGSRQDFVANVSHELKTPLTSVKVLADSLNQQEDVPVELYREFMQDITDEIDRENKIINDLLSMVRMDKAIGGLEASQVDMDLLLETVLKRLRPIANGRNVELTYECIRPVTALVDEVKMIQIFTNLVENAIKYNKENGWVRVTLNADYQNFTVTVADSGIGIPTEDYDHIFERFYRVDKSHSREIGGTGLGLAITRSAVLLHRGTIRVESEEGEGTTFTVRIPLNYVRSVQKQ